MSKFEICYLAAMCTLIALNLVSIFVANIFGSRNTRIVFSVFAAGSLLLCLAILVMFNVKIDFYPAMRLYMLRGDLYAQLLVFLLTVFSASDLVGLINSLKRHRIVETGDADTNVELNNKQYPLVDNVRSYGETIHKDYTIIRKDK